MIWSLMMEILESQSSIDSVISISFLSNKLISNSSTYRVLLKASICLAIIDTAVWICFRIESNKVFGYFKLNKCCNVFW